MIKKIFALVFVSVLGFTGLASASADEVLICHRTDSSKNPVILISVSVNAEQAHLDHGDALLPDGEMSCPTGGDPE